MSIGEGSRINDNSAEFGGGILAFDCDVTMLAGDAGTSFLFFFEGIINNTATRDGGGIYAMASSEILVSGGEVCLVRNNNHAQKIGGCDGDIRSGAVMLGNDADSNADNSGSGGAIYATDPGTQVTIHNAILSANSAYNGGAVAIENQASLGVSRSPGGFCWSDVGYDCVGFYSNTATNYGGAFWIGTGGSSIIAQSYISGNNAGFLGSALYGTNSSNSLEGNFIVNNGNNPIRGGGGGGTAQNVIRLFSGSLILAHTTMADNNATNQLIAISDALGPGDLEFHHNAINNPGVDIFGFTAGATFNGSCSELHEIATVPDTNGMGTIGSDFFTGTDDDPYTSLYHTLNQSEAEDACGVGTYFPLFGDIDGEPRGWDNPDFINLDGPYDIGADETYLGDVIFRDNFGFASIILR